MSGLFKISRIRQFHLGLAVSGLALLSVAPANAASPAKDRNRPDDLPVLVSTDHGGPKWKTIDQLKKFAERGDPQARFQLAELLVEGSGDLPKDVKHAAALFEQAAQAGVVNGWFRLGKIYHDGLAGSRDYGRALEYFALAARGGVSEAQHNIGAMFVSARGVRRNYVEGLAWLIVGAKSGVGQSAVEQVRARLAKKPREIEAAESRAAEILGDLANAEVPGVRSAQAENVRPPEFAPKKIASPTSSAAPMAKPVILLSPTAPFSMPVSPALSDPPRPKDKR